MKVLETIFVILISTCVINASLLEPVVENVVHINASLSTHGPMGTWKKKTIWKPRWVKEWKSAKVMKPTWKKVWSPVLIQEWIPFPKPPRPEWKTKKSTPLVRLPIEEGGKLPLWDPMPYPESQQPPPALPSPAQFRKGGVCHHKGCRGSSSHPHGGSTFTQDQISQIIGHHNRYKKATDYSKNSKQLDSRSTRLSEVPADAESWRTRRQSPFGFLINSPFNIFPELSQFLVPPKFQAIRNTDAAHTPKTNKPGRPIQNVKSPGVSRPAQVPPQNPNQIRSSVQRRPSLSSPQKPPGNAVKPNGHLHKYQVPNGQVKNNSVNQRQVQKPQQTGIAPSQMTVNPNNKQQTSSNFIQPAELVGEYHYETEYEFNRAVKPELQNSEQVEFKPLPASLWSLPTFGKTSDSGLKQQEKKQNIQQLFPDSQGKPRPIRKDSDSPLINHLAQTLKQQHVTLQPTRTPSTAVFEQEKAITKEIFPLYDITPNPFPENHKSEAGKNDQSGNIASATPATADLNPPSENRTIGTSGGNEHREQSIDPKPTEGALSPIRLSEEALLNAIQNNRTNAGEKLMGQSTTTPPFYPSTSSSTTKSPVYIVTPIYQSKSN